MQANNATLFVFEVITMKDSATVHNSNIETYISEISSAFAIDVSKDINDVSADEMHKIAGW